MSWALSGGQPDTITLAPSSGTSIPPDATSTSVSPLQTQDYTLTVSNAAGSDTEIITLAVVTSGSLKYSRALPQQANSIAKDASGRLISISLADGDYKVGGVTVSDQQFLAIHTVSTGAIEKISGISVSNLSWANAIIPDGQQLLVVGKAPLNGGTGSRVLRYNSDFTLADSDTFFMDSNVAYLQYATDVAVDGSRNVFVVGNSFETATSYVSRSNAGFDSRTTIIPEWQTWTVAVDSKNNVFTGGDTFISRRSNTLTGTVSDARTQATLDLAIDHSDNVVAAGGTQTGSVRKLNNQLSKVLWEQPVAFARGVTVDDADNVFVLGDDPADASVSYLYSFTATGAVLFPPVAIPGGREGTTICDSEGSVFTTTGTTILRLQ